MIFSTINWGYAYFWTDHYGYKTMQRRFQDTEGAGQEMTRCNIDAVYVFAYVFAYGYYGYYDMYMYRYRFLYIYTCKWPAPRCALKTCWVPDDGFSISRWP